VIVAARNELCLSRLLGLVDVCHRASLGRARRLVDSAGLGAVLLGHPFFHRLPLSAILLALHHLYCVVLV